MSIDKDKIEVTAGDKVRKSNAGKNAALVLMQACNDFKDKIEKCAESQEDPESKQRIEAFSQQVDNMYETLMDVASNKLQNDINEIRGKEDTPPVMVGHNTVPTLGLNK